MSIHEKDNSVNVTQETEEQKTSYGDINNTSSNFKKTNIVNYKPKIKIDPKRQRYPYCLVWTTLPCFSWFIPCIGHVGICSSEGIIHDFAGPYFVSIDEMAFGNPTKYIMLDLNEREYDEYDKAVESGTNDYNNECYNFCCNNCHSFVAHCFNKLNYKNKNNYTMVDVWCMFCIKSKYISLSKFIQTYIGFLCILIIVFLMYLLSK